MLDYMDQVQAAWLDATSWNRDSSYSNLTATVQGEQHSGVSYPRPSSTTLPLLTISRGCPTLALLDFPIPRGLRLSVSSLSAANLATSYTLGSVGIVDGSVSYLYSSVPLSNASTSLQSATLGLASVVQGYHRLRELRRPDEAWRWEIWHRGKRIDKRGELAWRDGPPDHPDRPVVRLTRSSQTAKVERLRYRYVTLWTFISSIVDFGSLVYAQDIPNAAASIELRQRFASQEWRHGRSRSCILRTQRSSLRALG